MIFSFLAFVSEDEYDEKCVSVMLEGEETEMVFIDHPHSEISVNARKKVLTCLKRVGSALQSTLRSTDRQAGNLFIRSLQNLETHLSLRHVHGVTVQIEPFGEELLVIYFLTYCNWPRSG